MDRRNSADNESICKGEGEYEGARPVLERGIQLGLQPTSWRKKSQVDDDHYLIVLQKLEINGRLVRWSPGPFLNAYLPSKTGTSHSLRQKSYLSLALYGALIGAATHLHDSRATVVESLYGFLPRMSTLGSGICQDVNIALH